MPCGLFDAFPHLQMIVGHHLGILAWTASRAAYGFPPEDTALKRDIMSYVRKKCLWRNTGWRIWRPDRGIDPSYSLSFNAYTTMVKLVGIDRILFTTDGPYRNMVVARSFFDRMPIGPTYKAKIANINAKRLLAP
jgi:uncharacterized protein